MVRLVFRPYTQVRRSICTSESLWTSTRVSSGFILLRHSSPSFGSQRVRSISAPPTMRNGRDHGAPSRLRGRGPMSASQTDFHSHFAVEFRNPMTCAHVRLLGPCFKTGRMGDRQNHRNWTHTLPAHKLVPAGLAAPCIGIVPLFNCRG